METKITTLFTILLIVLSSLLFFDKIETEKKQKIDITMQIEKLAEGDSIVVTNLVYPDVFRDIKRQLQTPQKLISGDEKIRFGLNKYNWLAHVTSGKWLKGIAMDTDDHLIHYKIEFREEDRDITGRYPVELMRITRY